MILPLIGYIIDYKELEAKVKVILYDYTGIMEINFFNKIDNQDSSGLNKINYDGQENLFKYLEQ